MRKTKSAEQVISELRNLAEAKNREGMARYGIETSNALGVSMPNIRSVAKSTKRNHELALSLWKTGLHEARILAGLLEEPDKVTREQMDEWVADFNSWDVCDQVCMNLFDRLPQADDAIMKWHTNEREFVKRAAFAMIAARAVHLKKLPDDVFLKYLPMIRDASSDQRNFVKKAVNWALRQIGKRSAYLHTPALALAKELAANGNKSAGWIGRDAVKELESAKVLARLGAG